MCSIAGFMSKKPLNGDTALRLACALLYHGESRGSQSAGAWVDGKVLKRAMDPIDFINLVEFDKLFKNPVNCVLLHTRQPTSGGTGDNQAQPFTHDTTASIHNGWFTNIDHLKKIWNIQKESGVDSELVTSFVHTYGIQKLPEFVKSAEGSSAMAVVYRGSLYLMRSGNPTAYTSVDLQDDNTVFIFASTDQILKTSIHHTWLLSLWHPIKETKEGRLFKITPEHPVKITKQKVFHRPSMRQSTEYWWDDDKLLRAYLRGDMRESWGHYRGIHDTDKDIKYFKPNQQSNSPNKVEDPKITRGYDEDDDTEIICG